MNQLGLYSWKNHKETPCTTILNNVFLFYLFIYLFIYLFYKNEEQEGKTGPFWGIGTIVARGMWEEGVTG
jgi:hypothetical protein